MYCQSKTKKLFKSLAITSPKAGRLSPPPPTPDSTPPPKWDSFRLTKDASFKSIEERTANPPSRQLGPLITDLLETSDEMKLEELESILPPKGPRSPIPESMASLPRKSAMKKVSQFTGGDEDIEYDPYLDEMISPSSKAKKGGGEGGEGNEDVSQTFDAEASGISITEHTVKFSTVEIRSFPMILGDNPSVSKGPPVTLAWDYDSDILELIEEEHTRTAAKSECVRLALENYPSSDEGEESPRSSTESNHATITPRHSRRLSMEDRLRFVMHDPDVKRGEIDDVIDDVKKTKIQRRDTIEGLPFAKIDDAVESAARKFARFWKRGSDRMFARSGSSKAE